MPTHGRLCVMPPEADTLPINGRGHMLVLMGIDSGHHVASITGPMVDDSCHLLASKCRPGQRTGPRWGAGPRHCAAGVDRGQETVAAQPGPIAARGQPP